MAGADGRGERRAQSRDNGQGQGRRAPRPVLKYQWGPEEPMAPGPSPSVHEEVREWVPYRDLGCVKRKNWVEEKDHKPG